MKYISNQQKAKEIANDNCTHICLADCSAESYFSSENDCYNAAMQMAQWKDEQYKELKEATQTLYESARKVAQLYEPLQLALNKVFWEINIKQELQKLTKL